MQENGTGDAVPNLPVWIGGDRTLRARRAIDAFFAEDPLVERVANKLEAEA